MNTHLLKLFTGFAWKRVVRVRLLVYLDHPHKKFENTRFGTLSRQRSRRELRCGNYDATGIRHRLQLRAMGRGGVGELIIENLGAHRSATTHSPVLPTVAIYDSSVVVCIIYPRVYPGDFMLVPATPAFKPYSFSLSYCAKSFIISFWIACFSAAFAIRSRRFINSSISSLIASCFVSGFCGFLTLYLSSIQQIVLSTSRARVTISRLMKHPETPETAETLETPLHPRFPCEMQPNLRANAS